MVEIDYHKNMNIMRERYEKLLEIPLEEITAHDLFELMRFSEYEHFRGYKNDLKSRGIKQTS